MLKKLTDFIFRFRQAWNLARMINLVKNGDTGEIEVWITTENSKDDLQTYSRIA